LLDRYGAQLYPQEKEDLILVGYVFYLLIALAAVAIIWAIVFWIKGKKGRA
jgi:hypothetical protein